MSAVLWTHLNHFKGEWSQLQLLVDVAQDSHSSGQGTQA
eukprot:CAMPEP_0180497852 /NCGR_PEP_ID=MMETSP1036_2-20121128/43015_1 /TAXON_ID=632150 /ORGANISM="Azadinium spinosum, Strain 3D9" /LENGTH=38 /DNA_ID= /DNA_START= /DNA_END= /DNA_ORIENTATION=